MLRRQGKVISKIVAKISPNIEAQYSISKTRPRKFIPDKKVPSTSQRIRRLQHSFGMKKRLIKERRGIFLDTWLKIVWTLKR